MIPFSPLPVNALESMHETAKKTQKFIDKNVVLDRAIGHSLQEFTDEQLGDFGDFMNSLLDAGR